MQLLKNVSELGLNLKINKMTKDFKLLALALGFYVAVMTIVILISIK